MKLGMKLGMRFGMKLGMKLGMRLGMRFGMRFDRLIWLRLRLGWRHGERQLGAEGARRLQDCRLRRIRHAMRRYRPTRRHPPMRCHRTVRRLITHAAAKRVSIDCAVTALGRRRQEVLARGAAVAIRLAEVTQRGDGLPVVVRREATFRRLQRESEGRRAAPLGQGHLDPLDLACAIPGVRRALSPRGETGAIWGGAHCGEAWEGRALRM